MGSTVAIAGEERKRYLKDINIRLCNMSLIYKANREARGHIQTVAS